ncbi:MAG: hypothetical protein FWG68_04180 [Defluviitaleaceae bacterium]|nr:hypothetical protein [Defluviitaleaceae bacterium]
MVSVNDGILMKAHEVTAKYENRFVLFELTDIDDDLCPGYVVGFSEEEEREMWKLSVDLSSAGKPTMVIPPDSWYGLI